jgi:chemotaxis protein MotB
MSPLHTAGLDERDDESWMMTYLDMMTLLLVVTMAMLAIVGKTHVQAIVREPVSMPLWGQGILPHGLALLGRPKAVVAPEPVMPAPEVEAEKVAVQSPEDRPPEPVPQPDDPLKDLDLGALGKDIEVITNQRSVTLRISSEFLFDSAEAQLRPEGLQTLHGLLPALSKTRHQVIVQGHTDSEIMHSPRYPTNWELSSARAASVVRYLQDNGVDGGRLSAVGYGEMRPLADNATEAGRAANRRVEIILQTSAEQ